MLSIVNADETKLSFNSGKVAVDVVAEALRVLLQLDGPPVDHVGGQVRIQLSHDEQMAP